MKQKFDIITSTCVPLPLENVDTDQIIPARFLKATTKEERFFGDNLFRDWRYNSDGTLNKDFVLNNPKYKDAIETARKETWAHIGESAALTVDYMIEKANILNASELDENEISDTL